MSENGYKENDLILLSTKRSSTELLDLPKSHEIDLT